MTKKSATAVPAKAKAALANLKAENKANKAKQATTKPEATAEAKPKGKAKQAFPKKAGGDGKPGIIASIIEFLQSGTAKQPVTKKELLAKLAKRFPDREEKAMRQTINCQVPARLRTDKELDVQKNDNGYWLKA